MFFLKTSIFELLIIKNLYLANQTTHSMSYDKLNNTVIF